MECISFTLQHPSTMWLVSPSGGGKTSLVERIIDSCDNIYSKPIKTIVFVYAVFQPIYYRIQHKHPNVKFTKNLRDAESLVDGSSLLVIDDCLYSMNNGSKGEDVKLLTDWHTTLGHHMDTSLIVCLQNVYNKSMRTCSINVHYMCIYRQPRDLSTIKMISRQISPSHSKFLVDAYEKATENGAGYSYIFIDLHPRSNQYKYFVRSNIFNSGSVRVFSPE